MSKSMKLRIAAAVCMLAAAACVLVGKSIISGPGFSLSYNYIDALIPSEDSRWDSNAALYVRILFGSGILAAILVWLKPRWASLLTGAVCLSSLVFHVIRSIGDGYSVFQIDGIWEALMLLLPLIGVILCLLLFKAAGDEE